MYENKFLRRLFIEYCLPELSWAPPGSPHGKPTRLVITSRTVKEMKVQIESRTCAASPSCKTKTNPIRSRCTIVFLLYYVRLQSYLFRPLPSHVIPQEPQYQLADRLLVSRIGGWIPIHSYSSLPDVLLIACSHCPCVGSKTFPQGLARGWRGWEGYLVPRESTDPPECSTSLPCSSLLLILPEASTRWTFWGGLLNYAPPSWRHQARHELPLPHQDAPDSCVLHRWTDLLSWWQLHWFS